MSTNSKVTPPTAESAAKLDFHTLVTAYNNANKFNLVERVEIFRQELHRRYVNNLFPTVNDWGVDVQADVVRHALIALKIDVPSYRKQYPHRLKSH